MVKSASARKQLPLFKLGCASLVSLCTAFVFLSIVQHSNSFKLPHLLSTSRVSLSELSANVSRTLRSDVALRSKNKMLFGAAQLRKPSSVGEGISQPIPVFITYKTTLGLCNQLLAHINALAVAHYMRSTLIMATALARNSFSEAHPTWTSVPPDSILDVPRMQRHWQERRLPIVRDVPNLHTCTLIDLSGDYYFTRTVRGYWKYLVPEAAAELSGNITTRLTQLQHANMTTPPCVRLELGNPHMLLNQELSVRYLRPAAEGLFIAPNVTAAAAQVLDALKASGHASFVGVHLRLESDFADSFLRSMKDPVQPYIGAMKQAGFTAASGVYVASGIFSSWNNTAVEELLQRLRGEQVLGTLLHKEALVHSDVFKGFNAEQLGLIDLLVLEQSSVFVGDPVSSFACYLREMRALRGVPKSTFFATRAQMPVQYYFARRLLQEAARMVQDDAGDMVRYGADRKLAGLGFATRGSWRRQEAGVRL